MRTGERLFRWGILAFTVITVALLITMCAERRYRAKPFFAGNFLIVGEHGGFFFWEFPRSLGLSRDLSVYYDVHECVLLAVYDPGAWGGDGWYVDRRPVGETLPIRRMKDGLTREIPWRRDSIIYTDEEGVPTYADISQDEFWRFVYDRDAETIDKLLKRVNAKGAQSDEDRQEEAEGVLSDERQ